MTQPATLSAKDFMQPLLTVLGELTGMVPGTEVKHEVTYDKVFKILGITDVNAYGHNNDTPFPKRWTQFAYSALCDEGLCEKMGRGIWTITAKGVEYIRNGTPMSDQDVNTPADEMVDSSLNPSGNVPLTIPVEAVSVDIGYNTDVDYHPDPHIQRLGRKSTGVGNLPCFGYYSIAEAVCQACPLRKSCINKVSATLSELAQTMAKEDEANVRAREAARSAVAGAKAPPAPSGNTGVPRPTPPGVPPRPPVNAPTAPASTSLPPAPSPTASGAFDPSTVDLTTARLIKATQGIRCKSCGNTVVTKDPAVWVRGSGAGGRGGACFHPECFKVFAPNVVVTNS